MSEMEQLRNEIDKCDLDIAIAYARRLELVAKIAEYKKENGLPVYYGKRETEVLDKVGSLSKEHSAEIVKLYEFILAHSKEIQDAIVK